MSERQSLLAAIAETPDDDAVRLVFADWLDDHGESDRAEFIRVQMERTRLPKWDRAQVRLRVLESALLAKHGKTWRAELPKLPGVEWGEFRRGFVAEARLKSFAVLRETGWREAAPIEAVSLPWPKKGVADGLEPIVGLRELTMAGKMVAHADADRLSSSPLLSTLGLLDITGCAVGLEGLRRVIASPHLGRLRVLRLGDNSLGNGIGAALSAAPGLGPVEELDLSESGDAGYYGDDVFTADGMAELGTWPGMANVRRLDLSGHDLRRGQFQALLSSPHASGLKELRFLNNHNYEGWGEILDAAPAELDLAVLDITGGQYRGDAELLAGNRRLRHLKELRIHGVLNPDSSDDLAALASAPFMSTLRILSLDGETYEDGLRPLLDAAPPHLHTLDLTHSYLDLTTLNALADSPASDDLLDLILSEVDLSPEMVQALGQAKHLRNLLVLRVGSCEKKMLHALAASPLGRRLLLLDRSQR